MDQIPLRCLHFLYPQEQPDLRGLPVLVDLRDQVDLRVRQVVMGPMAQQALPVHKVLPDLRGLKDLRVRMGATVRQDQRVHQQDLGHLRQPQDLLA